jgi:hypothetical protein
VPNAGPFRDFQEAFDMTTAYLPMVPDTMELYVAQIKQFDLLSREEEYRLAVAYRQDRP